MEEKFAEPSAVQRRHQFDLKQRRILQLAGSQSRRRSAHPLHKGQGGEKLGG